MSGVSIGIMNDAFFVGRKELISWVNETYQLNVQKVEDCGTGAVYCQILDSIYPGKVPMSKVNFNAKLEYENVENFKVLQNCFEKIGIKRAVPVNTLIRCKYQDNLEFLQFMYSFYKSNANTREPYNPVARRSKGKGGAVSNRSTVPVTPQQAKSQPRVSTPPVSSATKKKQAPAPAPVRAPPTQTKQQARPGPAAATAVGGRSKTATPASNAALEHQINKRQERLQQLLSLDEGMDTELSFYQRKVDAVQNLLDVDWVEEQDHLLQAIRAI